MVTSMYVLSVDQVSWGIRLDLHPLASFFPFFLRPPGYTTSCSNELWRLSDQCFPVLSRATRYDKVLEKSTSQMLD